jgi:hypothetical protein
MNIGCSSASVETVARLDYEGNINYIRQLETDVPLSVLTVI